MENPVHVAHVQELHQVSRFFQIALVEEFATRYCHGIGARADTVLTSVEEFRRANDTAAVHTLKVERSFVHVPPLATGRTHDACSVILIF